MKFIDIIINTIVSAMIGGVVGIVANIMNPSLDIPRVLFVNCTVGIIIGSISALAYYYVYEKKRLGIKLTLGAIFIVIFIIMLGLALSQGMHHFSLSFFIFIVAIVEFLSLGYVYLTYRDSIRYNKKLRDKKEELLKNKNSN